MSIPGRLADALADRYVIERELGAGGMATVYRARDVRHDGHVGLKVMRPALTAVIGAERFLREVKTTAGYDRCGGLYGVAWGSDADCFARNDDSAAGGEVAGVAGECVTEGVGDRVDIVRPVSGSMIYLSDSIDWNQQIDAGEPQFHELEPDCRLVTQDRRALKRGVIPRDAQG